MRAVDIIIKKRDNVELSREEIRFFIDGFVRDEIPDYQASAFAMAILLNGMSAEETANLTLEMVNSGETIDLSSAVPFAVDKHSTGGVGDKTTLVVGPVVSACGLPVGKMSGRGLGFSGGTLDKMEAIPGFRTDLSIDEFLDQLKRVGIVLTGQTGELAPADGKLYSLRDVTGTVRSIPLIASSVMSKKIAAGAQAIVLDVKVGSGAFVQTLDEACELAKTMVDIASLADRSAVAYLSDMNQPLGEAVGNSIEVVESINTLQGRGPDDFVEHCTVLAAQMLVLGNVAEDENHGRDLVKDAILNGNAFERFRQLVLAQGGDVSYVDNPDKFPETEIAQDVYPDQDGYLKGIDARVVGETAVLLGAGRAVKSDLIDHAVGILVHKKVGDYVSTSTPVFSILANQEKLVEVATERLKAGLHFSTAEVPPLPLFYGMYDERGNYLELHA